MLNEDQYYQTLIKLIVSDMYLRIEICELDLINFYTKERGVEDETFN